MWDAAQVDLELPDDVTLARTTPTFDQDSVPAGLLSAHRTAEQVWGRLVVLEGTVGFVFEDETDEVRRLSVGDRQVIPPGRAHHVVLDGPAKFHVEFHR